MPQPTDHPDSFSVFAVSDSMGDMNPQEPKRITVWESMTVKDLDDTCKRAFSSQPVWKIEVLWKENMIQQRSRPRTVPRYYVS